MTSLLSWVLRYFSIKAHLLCGFGIMVLLTVAVGGVGWWGISTIQRALEALQQESLAAIAQSLLLAERSASLVAQAPFVANAKILFHLDEESARLGEKLAGFRALLADLDAAAAEPGLAEIAGRIEQALLQLIDTTRQSIFLTARMRDRQYELASTYAAVESRLSAAAREAEAARPLLLAQVLGETHRLAGVLAAAAAAEAGEDLGLHHQRYRQSAAILESGLARLDSPDLAQRLRRLMALGSGDDGIFQLRRRLFDNEDRRAYLLTASTILAARLNDQVTAIVDRARQATDRRSAEAAAVVQRSETRILLLGLLGLAAALLSAYYVVRELGGNLSAITQAMIRLAGGDRSIAVPAMGRSDEIGRLARACNVFKESMFRLDETSRQLAASNRLLEAVFRSLNDGLAVVDAAGRLLAWNPRFCALYRLPAEALEPGMPLARINALPGRQGVVVRGLDGQPLAADMFPGQRRQVEEHLPDGRVLELRASPMPDGGFVTLYTDLTERKAIESQLRQAQKMESVGQLTGGLAHDFNNLLAAVIGNLSLLQEELRDQEHLRRKALRALDAAERGATITQRLLAFSRKQALQPRPVDANELVAGMLDLLACSVGDGVTIDTRLQQDLWPVVI
nr:PAS-domain containing protein [Pseudomonadota bacterium]